LLETTQVALTEARNAFDQEFPPLIIPAPPGHVYRCAVGDNVQAALDNARTTGGVLLLAVGVHLVNLRVRADPAARPVLITSDTASLPDEGQRMTRDYLEGLAQLKSANNLDPTLRYDCASSGVHLTGVAFLPMQYDRTVIDFGTDGMNTVDEQPHDVVFDRLLMLGDPVRGQHRGIMAHCRAFSLLNSSLLDFHEQGRDSQALAAWNGGQDLVIRNCHLEAGAENVLFGGANARTPEMNPCRILFEDNLFSKNPAWVSGMEYKPSIKCLFEVKNASQLTLRRNIFEHCWAADWSSGVAVQLKSNSNDEEPFQTMKDVLVENNIIRKCGEPFSIVGKFKGGEAAGLGSNIVIRNNLCYDVDTDVWQGKSTLTQISNFPDGLVFDHNTCVGNTWGAVEYWFDQPLKGQGFTLTNSAFWHGGYGMKGASGMDYDDWAKDLGYAPTVTGLALRNKEGDRKNNWGAGNVHVPAADFDASFGADYSVLPGSAVAAVASTDGTPIGCDVSLLPTG
jgi:hypothetical protein